MTEYDIVGLGLKIAVILLFALIFIEDIKTRTIRLITLIALFFMIIGVTINEFSIALVLMDFFFNIGFVFLELSLILLYLFVRYRKKIRSVQDYIGGGDILFWLVITPLFPFPEFIYVYTGSLIVSILLHFFLTFHRTYNRVKIPLAGFQSLYLIFVLTLKWTESI